MLSGESFKKNVLRILLNNARHVASLIAIFFTLAIISDASWADQSTDQIALAASGRYDQLEKQLESQLAKGPLDTRDRHAICGT